MTSRVSLLNDNYVEELVDASSTNIQTLKGKNSCGTQQLNYCSGADMMLTIHRVMGWNLTLDLICGSALCVSL